MKEQEVSTYEIYAITTSPSYKELFSQMEGVTLVVQLGQVEEGVVCKAVFVDGDTIPASELKFIRALYATQPIFYKMANVQNQYILKNILTTCNAYNISALNEGLTATQVKEELELSLFHKDGQSKKRIVSFFGTHSGAGVSTTLMNVADLLAKRIDGRVLVLSLNPWDVSDYFLDFHGRYLNDLNIDLKTKTLTDEKFLNSVHQYPGSFYHLAGNRDIKLQRFFQIEEMEYLLQRARALFDVVLVDGGPHFDNACYAQAYRESDLRFLVTTQEPKGYQGYWPHIFTQLLEPLGASTHDFLLILNRFSPENALATEKDIMEQLNMSLLSTIPDEGVLGSSAITQKRLLHANNSSKEYAETLQTIVNAIIGQYHLKVKTVEINQESKGFLGGMFKRKKETA
ncbi:MAG: ParA family protein [Paenisporosarcina sp.]|nr:ParA family protein [Paenisporosarcina sp.]